MSEEREYKKGREANEEPDVEAHVKQGREADASTASEDVEAHVKQGREMQDDGENVKNTG